MQSDNNQEMFRLLKVEYVVIGLNGLQAKYLDECSCLFAEMEPCLNHFGVVEYHQASGWQIFR